MIQGIGNDIIEVERIHTSIDRHGSHFLDRLFTKDEQHYCFQHKHAAMRFAGRFCAKEAVVKAFGVGFGKEIGWHDIEIVNNEKGKPSVKLSPHVLSHFNRPNIQISISHTEKYATAVAVWSS